MSKSVQESDLTMDRFSPGKFRSNHQCFTARLVPSKTNVAFYLFFFQTFFLIHNFFFTFRKSSKFIIFDKADTRKKDKPGRRRQTDDDRQGD